MSRSLPSLNAELDAALAEFPTEVRATVRSALGAPTAPAVVVAYVLERGPGLVRLFLLTAGRFMVVECSQTGDRLLIAMPRRQIRRVFERSVARALSVQIEVDAGVATMVGTSTIEPDGSTATERELRPRMFELVADEVMDPGKAAAISRFAQTARTLLDL